MKKIVLLTFIVGLIGCKESNTSLDKAMVNSSFSRCHEYLKNSLKSPSSLKIDSSDVVTYIPKPETIYTVFGSMIIDKGKIKSSVKDSKTRFRGISTEINYEAQNSFGVFLKGKFQCEYIFELKDDANTPNPLDTYLIKLVNDGEDMNLGVHIPFDKFTGSSILLDNAIKNISGTNTNLFNPTDEQMYGELEEQYVFQEREKEAEKFKQDLNW